MLYLVATPIGNLEDITHRAVRTLREVNVIAAEDTRQTRKLVQHYDIKTPLISYHEHSGPAATDSIIHRLSELEQSVALVTDAGTPGISDPGFDLVTAAIQAGVTVVPIPGASAVLSALTASGIPTARFLFEGFLPRTRSSRVEKLKELAAEKRTLVFYESPQRLGPTLAEMLIAFGDRPACVAREITKKFEEFRRASLRQLAADYSGEPPRGECVIVVYGLGEDAPKELPAETADPGSGRNDLLKLLASEMGVNRRELYQAILKLRRKE